MTARARAGGLMIETLPWATVQQRLAAEWRFGEHMALWSWTWGGKSFFTRHGLMPLCRNDRVCVIEVKGPEHDAWRGWGQDVTKLPRWRLKEGPEHYRLIVHEDRAVARQQVHSALLQMYREGVDRRKRWIIVCDEVRALTDPRDPNLNLSPQIERLYLRGRERVSLVSLTQAPRWAPPSMYDQSRWHIMGGIEDRRQQQRLREIGGWRPEIEDTVANLGEYEFLVLAPRGTWAAITKVTKGSAA